METRANHILIGLFVLLSLAGGLGFVYWASDISASRTTRSYVIEFEGSVRGLARSSDVLFNGLKVGKVRAVRINGADTRKVEVVIAVAADTPVRSNSSASIAQQGLTGYPAVQISPGTLDAPMLTGALEPPYPQIGADPGLAAGSLTEALPELLAKANSALERINSVVADNQDSVRKAITDLQSFAGTLKSNGDDVTAIVRSVRGFTDDLGKAKETIASIGSAFDKLNALVERNQASIDTTLKSTASFTSSLDAHREDVAAIIVNIKDLSGQLKGVSSKLDLALDQVSGLIGGADSQGLITGARAAVESFRSLADKLDQQLMGDDGLAIAAKRGIEDFSRFMREGQKAAAGLERTFDSIDHNPQSLIFGAKKVPEYNPQ